MVMWKFRSCPRCGGDIFIDRDADGWYKECLQCGSLHHMPSTIKVHQHGKKKRKEELLPQRR